MKIRRIFCILLAILLTTVLWIPTASATADPVPFLDISDWYADKDYMERSGDLIITDIPLRQDYTTTTTNLSRVKSWITSYIFDCLESEWNFLMDGEHHDSNGTEKWGYYWLSFQKNSNAKKFKLKDPAGFTTDATHLILYYKSSDKQIQIRTYYSPDLEPVSQQGITVVPAIDLSEYEMIPEYALQDLVSWSEGESSYKDEPKDKADHMYYHYRSTVPVFEEYVAMLCKNGYTVVDEYDNSGWRGVFRSWGLTCDALPDAPTLKQDLTGTPCHISIICNSDGGIDYRMRVSPDLTVCDMGLRRSGKNTSIAVAGESAGAALLRLDDGSYQTADGRLRAAPGTATVIRDGKTYEAVSRYETSGNCEIFWVEDYYRTEGIFMKAEMDYLMEGDLFQRKDLARKRPTESSKFMLPKSNYGNIAVAFAHGDDKWIGPGLNEENFEALTTRILYYDKGEEAVIYYYARFKNGTPKEVEALSAVNLKPTDPFADATRMEVGDRVTLRYTTNTQSETVESYTWEILEGKENISISSTGNTCKVTAMDSGYAAIKVTFEYTKYEPDVLTDIPRRVLKSESKVYYLIIE